MMSPHPQHAAMRRAKIIATVGPASKSEETLRSLALAGVDVFRINMSHSDPESARILITRIRSISSELNRPIGIMVDLAGPKIRTGRLRNKEIHLKEGQLVHITSEDIQGDAARFSIGYKPLAREVQPGDRILIGDGQIELQVVETAQDEVAARVIHGGQLGERKGVNLPGVRLSIPPMTEKDRRDLQLAIESGADWVAQSFVRGAQDCQLARQIIQELGGKARLLAKIEKPEAVRELENILEVADGVMVARGDLAVETSPEQVPVLQKQILERALLAQKTAVTATQMLRSMVESPRPTRAEASDVANAILDGSDAVMLSEETAIGRFPVESVTMMDRIIRSAEQMYLADDVRNSPGAAPIIWRLALGRQSGSVGRAIAEAAVFAAEEIGSRLIVVFTQSGHMARRVAALRPRQRIIALTPMEESYGQLAITWGVEPYPLENFSPVSDQMLACGDRTLLRYNLARAGERVIVMAGRMPDIAISTSMKVHVVGESPRTAP